MIVDPGLPLGLQADLLALGGDYLDLAKIKTGTARLYPERLLRAKLARYNRRRVQPFLGGQFHEYVFATQGSTRAPAFYPEARRLGFAAIEISDNVVPLTPRERRAQIRAARASGPRRLRRGRLEGDDEQPEAARRAGRGLFRGRRRARARRGGRAGRAGRPNRSTLDLLVRSSTWRAS